MERRKAPGKKNALKPYVKRRPRRLRSGETVEYLYFPRPGAKEVRIDAQPDSPEFDRIYWKLRDGGAAPKSASAHTIAALIKAYRRHSKFGDLAPRTQRDYDKALDYIAAKVGERHVSWITAGRVDQAQQENLHRRRFARSIVETFSILGSFAVHPLEWLPQHPCPKVEKVRLAGIGYRAWKPGELLAFRKHCTNETIDPIMGTRARVWFELMISTSMRPSDALRVRWSDYDAGAGLIRLVQGKDRKQREFHLPVMPALADLLAATPKLGLTIIALPDSRPVSYRAAMDAFTQVRAAAELPMGARGVSPHGLRETMITLLAENGASDAEIQAISLHDSLTMVQHYRRHAVQKALALKAIDTLGQRG